MSKVVAGKSLKKNYTPISNELIRSSIDDSTFRLICWMTSHEEGFEINFTSIQNALGYGRDKLRKILKNAETHNYLVRRKTRTAGGLFDFEYHIFKDTSDAIAYRESLPQEELTSDLFSGGGATRGVKTGGGGTGGGSARGGESTPLLEKQLEENQKEENKTQEAPPEPGAPPTQECVCEETDSNNQIHQGEEQIPESLALQERSFRLDGNRQDSNLLTSLSNQSEFLVQTDKPSCRPTMAGSFDKVEQLNKQARPPRQDPFLNNRTLNPLKGTQKSNASDPWMKTANMPNEEFARWLFEKRYKNQPGKMLADAKAEIRNSFERASDLWDEYLAEKQPTPSTASKTSSEISPIGYFANHSLDWHKSTFTELLDLGDQIGKEQALIRFSTRYDQQEPGATLKWLEWIKLTHPHIYAHLHEQAA